MDRGVAASERELGAGSKVKQAKTEKRKREKGEGVAAAREMSKWRVEDQGGRCCPR